MNAKFPSVSRPCIGAFTMLAIACSPAPNSADNLSDNSIRYSCNTYLNIPQKASDSSYEQWHLLISRSGARTWNGQDVDDSTMRRYMTELSQMPANAGKLTIHIQPRTPCELVRDLRHALENSPLCVQGRCVQDRWSYERPVVN